MCGLGGRDGSDVVGGDQLLHQSGLFGLFLVFSLVVVSAVHAYRNMTELEVHPLTVSPVFAGEQAQVAVHVKNSGLLPAIGIEVRSFEPVSEEVTMTRLAPGEVQRVNLLLPMGRRGLQEIRAFALVTRYPFGVFEAEVIYEQGSQVLVYPHPLGQLTWPDPELDSYGPSEGRVKGGDDFYGVRPFQLGESPRRIDWKAVARGRPLMVKEFSGGGIGQVWFEWHKVPGVDGERRISQMTQWVLEAEKLEVDYGMRIPGFVRNPSRGGDHRKACLRELALLRIDRVGR
jgi:uncharacterized protein (DUF58 family)